MAACFFLANVAAQSPPPLFPPPPVSLPPLVLPSPPPPAVYGGSGPSKAIADAVAIKQLSGKTIRCVDFVSLRSSPDNLGDGYASRESAIFSTVLTGPTTL